MRPRRDYRGNHAYELGKMQMEFGFNEAPA